MCSFSVTVVTGAEGLFVHTQVILCISLTGTATVVYSPITIISYLSFILQQEEESRKERVEAIFEVLQHEWSVNITV